MTVKKVGRWYDEMLFSLQIVFNGKPGACINSVICINFKFQENSEIYHSWSSQAYCAWKNKIKTFGIHRECIYWISTLRSPLKHLSCRGSDNLMKFRKSDSFPKLQWYSKQELHFGWEESRQRKDKHWINWHHDF